MILNFEFKASCNDPDFILTKLNKLGAHYKGEDLQEDTYFNTPKGRLKLRKGNIENSLIFYERSNEAKARNSQIVLEKFQGTTQLDEVLEKAYGIKTIVTKKRKIFFIENVKFHVDFLEGLGSFFEVEAIDLDGSIGSQSLREQCLHYQEVFNIKADDINKQSYSDMIITQGEKVVEEVSEKLSSFIPEILNEMSKKSISFEKLYMDHVCYRVETKAQYEMWRAKFILCGRELSCTKVGGRVISTFKLFNPIIVEGREIQVIELPMPKEGSPYKEGFEHVEFVITDTFEDFIKKNSTLEFELKGMDKDLNKDVKLSLGDKSVKFHHQSLENVIYLERLS